MVADLQKIIDNPNELMRLINQMLGNNRVVWSKYDRYAIEKVLRENSYVFSAIQKIAKACVNIQLSVGQYDKNGKFIVNSNNPLAKLLNNPSPLMDGSEFKEYAAWWYMSYGELFIYGDRLEGGNNKGQVKYLYYAPPQITDIEAKGIIPTGYIVNGEITKKVDLNNMMHLKTFNPDFQDLHGLPYLAVASKLIDKLDSADETEVKNFQNGGPAYIATPKEVDGYTKTEHESLIEKLKNLWRNPKNKGGLVGTSASITIQELGKSPVDLGTLESSKNTFRMLCSVWGLDPGIFDVEASTYNNKQEINKAIYTEAAIPLMERLANKLTGWLGESYGVQVIIDTSNVEVLQPNLKTKIEWMILAETYTDNEIREATGYDARSSEVSNMTPNERLDIEAVKGFKPEDLDKPVI